MDDWIVAQLRVQQLFTEYLVVNGIAKKVFRELDYTKIQIPDYPNLSKLLETLATDFNNDASSWRGRKPDVMAISRDGRVGELIEVTVYHNESGAAQQLTDKLLILNRVNKVLEAKGLPTVTWEAANWRPPEGKLFYDLRSDNSKFARVDDTGEARWICYKPTYDLEASRGVVLWETHSLRFSDDRLLATVPLREDVRKQIEAAILANRPTEETAKSWAQWALTWNPLLKAALLLLVLVIGAAAAVVIIAAAIEVAVGVASAAVAIWLVGLAIGNNPNEA